MIPPLELEAVVFSGLTEGLIEVYPLHLFVVVVVVVEVESVKWWVDVHVRWPIVGLVA